MKKYVYLIMLILFASMLAVGCTGSNSDKFTSQENSKWADQVSKSTLLFNNETNEIAKAVNNNDYRTALDGYDKYKRDLDSEIKITDNFTVSPDLQSCKDAYRLGLLSDYSAATFMRSGIDQLMSGNLINSVGTIELGVEGLRSANGHYDNATLLLKAYNSAHPDSQLNITFMRHNVNATNEGASSQSTDITSNTGVCYWDWEYSTTKSISEYYTAPSGYSYAIVKIYLKNDADQKVTTNPYSWIFTADGIQYNPDSSTFSDIIGHQDVDVVKGGEIETKIVYLVKGDPSEANLTYDSFSAPKMENANHYGSLNQTF